MTIDLIGHFGSTLSYATVGGTLAEALLAHDALGTVVNLDDRVHPRWDKLFRGEFPRSQRVIAITDPREHIVEFCSATYSPENTYLFAVPNSSAMPKDRISACSRVGAVFTPSKWCEKVLASETSASVYVQPHGCSSAFWSCPPPSPGDRLRLVHFTTDGFWPGRKGTVELLHAWSIIRDMSMLDGATLTVHLPPQLYVPVYQLCGDLDILDGVNIVVADARGSGDEALAMVMAEHDAVVMPSRSEGFGILGLSALMARRPLLVTSSTGTSEYLADRDHGLHGWMAVASGAEDMMAGEHGLAPTVDAVQLALTVAALPRVYDTLVAMSAVNVNHREFWSWESRADEWARQLLAMEER